MAIDGSQQSNQALDWAVRETARRDVPLRTECRARLVMHEVGGVSPATTREPFVLPVNYVLDGADVVFRTAVDSPSAGLDGPVALEVDELIRAARPAWSVLIVGDATWVADPVEIARLSEDGLRPSPEGEHDAWIRIRPRRISGRRLHPCRGARPRRPRLLRTTALRCRRFTCSFPIEACLGRGSTNTASQTRGRPGHRRLPVRGATDSWVSRVRYRRGHR
ncbi:pyridoxamine 5'-phosphate oxidase family protein [Embleya sp. NBC_00896]|uniref:pyridoxamine 5'-phosphate oxidase family protein n=1 Tax=Embleya sp. NBC_00896 TaxID=2975961 RepID=UPI0038640232